MITNIQITHTEASLIRMVAKVDMPAYGLKEGQVFYCARSKSLGNNIFHILVWNYEMMRWDCPCECGRVFSHRVPCRHTDAASLDCSKLHSLQGYKPATKPVRTLNDARKERIARFKAARRAAHVAMFDPCLVA